MIRTVAVGTDGSETAGRAMDAAFEMAERFGARLVVLSAFDASAHPEWASNAAEQSERILAIAEESAAERGIECSSAMAEGDPGDVLVSLADEHGADMLVVGNRGMQRRILGSVPNTVSHKAGCSVFVVKTSP
jgi:nucleotide-binding universal stress UspA family protein